MKNEARIKNVAGWLPSNPETLFLWLSELKKEIGVELKSNKLKPVMREFEKLIEDDPIIRMYFTQMIDEVPTYYKENPGDSHYLKSIKEMIHLINNVLDKAPKFSENDLVGFPINAILDWTMGMSAGFAVFRDDKLNKMFQKILNEYGAFLSSKKSLEVLNDTPTGWMSQSAQEQLNMQDYQYDPNAPHWGFKSFNDFFTRKLKDGARVIDSAKNDKVIVSACDSQIYNIQNKVKKVDWFWVKAQPYSLNDMLAKDESKIDSKKYNDKHEKMVDKFVGGDVYQAFLNAFKYHRWHAPISGKIKEAYIKQGTYYSQAESEGLDPAGPNDSQGYISHVATRGLIFIEADNSKIGLMCIMFVGMAEVSSCKITVKVGEHVKKGDDIGYFQYGGSSYCMIFQPNTIKKFKVGKGVETQVGQKIAITN